ncbi:ribonuclease domain-containing protein [Fibrobacter sp.]|uniref:ribonuclease domain-containing protein n=1 Tax=Fibrobacter sp. TaxID=35828 RepID=UPI00386B1382
MKSIKVLFLATAACFFANACTVSAPEDNCKEASYDNILCYEYSVDDCGNIICAPPSSSDSKKFSSSSTVKSSSSEKTKSSSSVASSSSVKSKSIYEAVQESGKYTTRDSVAAYLCKFDKLPTNYVTQDEGKSLYESKTGKSFEKWNFNPWTTIGMMIGGDKFGNSEGLLPKGTYHEADVDYSAKNRGTKRLVYQSDCVIYYTADHYESFSQLEIK